MIDNTENSIHEYSGKRDKHNRFAMFMCYVSWLALRINVKIGGKNSRDAFKEMQSKIAMGVSMLFPMITIIILLNKYITIENKSFLKGLFITPVIIMICLSFWVDSHESKYYSIFEKMSLNERRKRDLCALLYIIGSPALLFGIGSLLY